MTFGERLILALTVFARVLADLAKRILGPNRG
jgi:hypothetical protein